MRLFYSILIGLLLFIGYLLKDNLPTAVLLERPSNTKPSNTEQHAASSAVNAVMEGVNSVQTTEQGSPRFTLHAKSAQQKSSGTVVLTLPVIVVYRANGKPSWHIQANRGYTDTHADVLRLEGHVQLTQLDEESAKGEQRVLKTSELLIVIKRRYATTDKPVVMMEGGSQLQATGLRADLAHDKILLLSHVNGKTQVQHHVNANS